MRFIQLSGFHQGNTVYIEVGNIAQIYTKAATDGLFVEAKSDNSCAFHCKETPDEIFTRIRDAEDI